MLRSQIMEFYNVRRLLGLLRDARIPVCVVGELALNYFNAPRVVHDLELCAQAIDLEAATALFEAQIGLLERADLIDFNLYTEYKRGFPRFRFESGTGFHVILFSDKHCRLVPLPKHIISQKEHVNANGHYSREILDSLSASEIATLPFPRFIPFLKGLCHTYLETQEVTAAIAAEFLVDGMNVDEEWCRTHFDPSDKDGLNFALGLVQDKNSRIDDFSPNGVTCFIAAEQEAQKLRKIPGF